MSSFYTETRPAEDLDRLALMVPFAFLNRRGKSLIDRDVLKSEIDFSVISAAHFCVSELDCL